MDIITKNNILQMLHVIYDGLAYYTETRWTN